MSAHHDYIVLRAPDLVGFKQEGYWFDLLRDFPRATRPKALEFGSDPQQMILFHPTNTFEVREDGAVAEVWEAERG